MPKDAKRSGKQKRVSISLSPDNVFHSEDATDASSAQKALMDMLATLGAPEETAIDTFRKNFPQESKSRTDDDIITMYIDACARREAARSQDGSPSTQAASFARRQSAAAGTPHFISASASKGDVEAAEPAGGAFQFPPLVESGEQMSSEAREEMDAFIRDVLGRKPRRASVFLREVEVAAVESAEQEEREARAIVEAAKKAAAAKLNQAPQDAARSANKVTSDDAEDPLQRPAGVAPICVHIEEEGVPLHKVIYVAPSVTFEEFQEAVEEKLQRKVLMTFKDQQDYVEIDDITVLSMFLYQVQCEQVQAAKAKAGQRRRSSYAGPNDYTRLICLSAPTPGVSAAQVISRASISAAQSPDHAARRTSRRFSAAFTSGLVAVQPIETYDAHKNGAHCCDYSPDGSRIVSVGRDREVRIWKTREGGSVERRQCTQMKGNHSGFVLCCSWSPRGNRIVTAATNGTIKIWDVESGEKFATLKGHDDRVYGIRYDPTGAFIASASCDGTLCVWDASIAGTSRKQLKVKYQPGTKYEPIPLFACDFAPKNDESTIATGGDNANVVLFNWREEKVVGTLKGHEGAIWSVRYSPDGTRLVTCANDNDARVWDVQTRTCLLTLTGHEAPVHCAVFSADSRFVFTCGRDWMIMAWDAKTGEHMETIAGHTNTVYHIETRGQEIISSSLDSSVKRWEVRRVD